jgi:hypothetical protein
MKLAATTVVWQAYNLKAHRLANTRGRSIIGEIIQGALKHDTFLE